MNGPVGDMMFFLIGAALAVTVVVGLCFLWGRFAARQALLGGSSKWSAYLLAVSPLGPFSLSLLRDELLAPTAFRVFLGLAVCAVMGAFYRWNWESSGFHE